MELRVELLNTENINKLVDFEVQSRVTEAEIFSNNFDKDSFKSKTLKALTNPSYKSCFCLLCFNEHENVVGRVDFCLLPSLAFGGDLRAYVDWVYVLKEERHKGIAQFLFNKMEEILRQKEAGEYILIVAENKDAQRFYESLKGKQIKQEPVLTREMEMVL